MHLLPILMVNFIGTLGYSIVMPFLVYLVAQFGGNAVVYGVIGATYSIFQFIGAPILGKYSDRARRSATARCWAGTSLNLPFVSRDSRYPARTGPDRE